MQLSTLADSVDSGCLFKDKYYLFKIDSDVPRTNKILRATSYAIFSKKSSTLRERFDLHAMNMGKIKKYVINSTVHVIHCIYLYQNMGKNMFYNLNL